MIERLQSWWSARTAREQGLLTLLMLIAVPAFLWYAVIRPFDLMLDRAQLDRDADARTLADVMLMANRIGHANRSVRNGLPIDAEVRSEADRAGFAVSGIVRDGVGAVMTIDAARAQPFFSWVAAVKARRGLIVTRLTARPNGDSTLSISVRFERAR